MTSTARVSEIKRGQAHHSKSGDGKPRLGTKLRHSYDALRRGEVVQIGKSRQLQDFYGMDIQQVKGETGRVIGSRLIGEWDGPYYVPIERIVSEEAESV